MSLTYPSVDSETAFSETSQKRERPPITEEEDRPFDDAGSTRSGSCGDSPAISRIEEEEQKHKHKVEDYKNIVGGVLLAVCFLIIVCFSLIDMERHVESNLFTGAFEFAKTIATAVIGYLFATNVKGA